MRFLTIQRQFAFLQRLLLSALCEAGINDRNRATTGATRISIHLYTRKTNIHSQGKTPFQPCRESPILRGQKYVRHILKYVPCILK